MKQEKRKRKRFYFLGSVVVTALVFYVIFSFVSVSQVVAMLRGADARGVMTFMALSFLMSYCRAWRYQILLRVSGFSPHIIIVFLVVLVGNFFSDLLPARLGTLVYVFIITTRLGVPFGASVSSFAVAFLYDLLSLAPLLLIIVIGLGGGSDLPLHLLLVIGVLIAACATLMLRYLPAIFHWGALHLKKLHLGSETKREKFSQMLESASSEIAQTLRSGVGTRLFLLSFVIRVIKYGCQYMFLLALLKPLGYQFENLSVAKVYLGICAAETAASVPFAGIAGFGVFEGTWVVVFKLLGFPTEIAATTSVAVHLFVQVWGYMLGAIALGILLLPIFKTEVPRAWKDRAQESNLVFYAKLLLCMLLFAIPFAFHQ